MAEKRLALAAVIPIQEPLVTELLERWLKEAKSGKYESIAIVGVTKDKSVEREAAIENSNPLQMLGAVETLKDMILRHCLL